jgi:hypothetical protein
MAQNSVNWLVKRTSEIYLLISKFIKIIRNEILHAQCTIQNAVTAPQIGWKV